MPKLVDKKESFASIDKFPNLFLNYIFFYSIPVISPQRVAKHVNSSVDIICTIDLSKSSGRNSTHLSFERLGKKKIPEDKITVRSC